MGIATANGRSRANPRPDSKSTHEFPGIDIPPRALQLLAGHPALVATAWAGRRYACLALGVQQASSTPPLVCVSTRCGEVIDPILRDARTFSLMALAPTERVLQRRLQESNTLRGMDIFDGVLMERTAAGLPVLASSLVSMECEIVRHIDLEADHQLYVGRVLSCRLREMMQAAC